MGRAICSWPSVRPASGHPQATAAPKDQWRQPAAPKEPEMTSRLRILWLALAAATATLAVFTTPAVVAGITLNVLD